MQWQVTGADRQTGVEKAILIEADNEASASRRASRSGLMVSDVRLLYSDDSMIGQQIVANSSSPPPVQPQPFCVDDTAGSRVPQHYEQPPQFVAPNGQQVVFQPVIQNYVTQQVLATPGYARWSPGVAALLSFIWPGLGQMYKGQVINGIAWMLLVITGYFALIIPGVVLHLFCIIGAASGDPYRR